MDNELIKALQKLNNRENEAYVKDVIERNIKPIDVSVHGSFSGYTVYTIEVNNTDYVRGNKSQLVNLIYELYIKEY